MKPSDHIIEIVSGLGGISVDKVKSNSRKREILYVKHVIRHHLVMRTHLNYNQIIEKTGGIHHSTIVSSLKQSVALYRFTDQFIELFNKSFEIIDPLYKTVDDRHDLRGNYTIQIKGFPTSTLTTEHQLNPTIGEYVGLNATVLLGKADAHNYSVTVKQAASIKTEHFTLTPDERENLYAMEGKEGFQDLLHEIQTAIEQRANEFYNKEIEKAL